MAKTDKELAVELAIALINSIAIKPTPVHKPITGEQVQSILKDCHRAIKSISD